MKWRAAPISSCARTLGRTSCGCRPSVATFSTRVWRTLAFIRQWVNGLDEYRKSLAPFTLEAAEQACGLSVETLKKVAHMIVEAKGVCILWAMGVTQHTMGSDSSTAISNLLLITGNYMRTGTGAYPLRGHNNVQGAGDQGAAPATLPGYQSVDDPEVRRRFEAAWGVKLPVTQGPG